MLGPPGLFVFEALVAEGWKVAVRRHPKDHVSVIASRGEHFTWKKGLVSTGPWRSRRHGANGTYP